MFIEWVSYNVVELEPIYLGGACSDDMTTYRILTNGMVENCPLLKCNHEEADDRMVFHVHHGITIDLYTKVIVASADTDVFVNLIHHFNQWKYKCLEQL